MAKQANPKSWGLYQHGDGSRRSYPGSVLAAAGLLETTLSIGASVALTISAGSALADAPNLLTAAESAATFDYYISPTGSDSNPGTQSQPWAITAINTKRSTYAGKRVGLLDGTYNVGSMMSTTRDAPALKIEGGTAGSPTVIAAVNARQATITANNGAYGGGNGNRSAMLSHDGTTSNLGYVTIDGLVLTGCSIYCLEFGKYDFTNSAIPGIIVQNCEITGNNASSSTVASGVNVCPIVVQRTTGAKFINTYIHDNTGWTDGSHFSAVYQWTSDGTIYEFCTLVATGGLHGKEGGNQGTIIRYNYIEWLTGPDGQNGHCIQGFDGATTGGLTQTSKFHNNVLVGKAGFFDLQAELGNGGWTTNLEIFNNTCIAPSGISVAGLVYYEQTASTFLLKFYNNIFYDGASPSGYGYALCNVDAFSICNFNCWGGSSGSVWNTVAGGNHGSTGATSRNFTGWKSAIGSLDAASVNTAASFNNQGPYALQYTVTTGAAYQTGKTGGTAGGSTVNMGAWDGIVTQIGHVF